LAAIPLTLYLGQSIFSERFSWRAATSALLGSLPALIVFQVILRAVCLATVVLAPLAFVGMYYLDQIILLERPSLTRIWRRRGAINEGRTGAILTLAFIDGLVIVVGTTLGTEFLAAFSRMWHGRGITLASSGADLLASLDTWLGLVAFWSACGFLTVFRFFTYLDMRIRREGWDVELRLRADETYAGLPRHDSERARVAAVVMLAAAFMVGVADSTHAGEGSADATTESGSARRAITRQSFPWYDSAADRYRPLIRPSSTPQANHPADGDTAAGGGDTGRRDAESNSSAGSDDGRDASPSPAQADPPDASIAPEVLGGLGWAIMTTVLFAATVGLIVLVLRHGLGDRRPEEHGGTGRGSTTAESPLDGLLPAGICLADGDPLARAAAGVEQEDYSTAVLFFQAWMIVALDRRGGLVLAPGKTTGQYRAEVAAAVPGIAPLFEKSCRLFEDAFFGHLAIDRAAFLEVWEQRGLVTAAASGEHLS